METDLQLITKVLTIKLFVNYDDYDNDDDYGDASELNVDFEGTGIDSMIIMDTFRNWLNINDDYCDGDCDFDD